MTKPKPHATETLVAREPASAWSGTATMASGSFGLARHVLGSGRLVGADGLGSSPLPARLCIRTST